MSAPPAAVFAFVLWLGDRGVGVTEALREGLPPWGLEAFAAATHLGDTVVLLALAALIYLIYDRRAGAFVLGALFCGFAVVIAAKAWFAVPRPPPELQYVVESGFGFPSGHAVGATVGWGAMALVLDRLWTARGRFVTAGVVAAVVALSRVAIGVHYLVDVVAGVVIGLAVLGVAARWLREDLLELFGLAGGLAAVAVAASAVSLDSAVLLGAVLGAIVAWQAPDPTARPYGREGVLAAGGVGLLLAVALAVVDPLAGAAFAGAALVAGALILTPVAQERWLTG